MRVIGKINLWHENRSAVLKLVSTNPTERKSSRVEVSSGLPLETRRYLIARHSGVSEPVSAELDSDLDDLAGMPISGLKKMYVDRDGKPVLGVRIVERAYGADGVLKDERQYEKPSANICDLSMPVKIIPGKSFSPEEVCRMFVIRRQLQIVHSDGLSYDFLHGIASKLEGMGMLPVGAGKSGKSPLILSKGGLPHRGFLSGKTDGNGGYCLILSLSNCELLVPQEVSAAATAT